MDERSIDNAHSASLDMMALNKTVVNARSVVRKAKTHLINKLVRNVADLKKKKGSDTQKEKNLQKAQRFLEEIDSMRTLKDDKIFKYSLANVSKFEDVAKSTVSPAARAMARLADHHLVKDYVQKFRDEQSDWRDLAAFMLMKQTGRKFKTSKQKAKTKVTKERKENQKVNMAQNVKASKVMTDVYTHGLFRDEEFQKAKETVDSDTKGELNFLQKRRLKIANEKKERQLRKLKLSQNKNSENQELDNKSKNNTPGNDLGEEEGDDEDTEESNVDSGGDDDDEEEETGAGEDVPEKTEIEKSRQIGKKIEVTLPGLKKVLDSDDEEAEGDDDDSEEEEDGDEDGEEEDIGEEDMEVSANDSEGDDSSSDDDDGSKAAETYTKRKGAYIDSKEHCQVGKKLEPHTANENSKKDRVETSKAKKTEEKEKVEHVKSTLNSKNKKEAIEPLTSEKTVMKATIEPLGSVKSSKKDKVEPLSLEKKGKKDTVDPLDSKKNSKKDIVEPLNSQKKIRKKSNECVVKQLNIGSVSDESDSVDEEDSDDDGVVESAEEEEKGKHAKRKRKKDKPVPKFLTEEVPTHKKLPKDSFFEGGDFDSDEDSEKEGSGDDDKSSNEDGDDESQEIQGNRGMIKSMIYGTGRGRGRGRGRGNNSGVAFKFGGGKEKKGGKKSGGHGGDYDASGDPFLFGSKEVMYKRRNQTLITGEGKRKLVTEPEPKPKLHPSWEASRKRKAEESGGIQAFAGKRISFDD